MKHHWSLLASFSRTLRMFCVCGNPVQMNHVSIERRLLLDTARQRQFQCVLQALNKCGKAIPCCSCKATPKLMVKILVRTFPIRYIFPCSAQCSSVIGCRSSVGYVSEFWINDSIDQDFTWRGCWSERVYVVLDGVAVPLKLGILFCAPCC